MYFLDPSLQIPINHSWSMIVAGVVVTSLNNTTVMPPTSPPPHRCSIFTAPSLLSSPSSQPITADYSQRSSALNTDCLHTWVRTEDHGTTPMVDTPEEMCGLLSIKIIN